MFLGSLFILQFFLARAHGHKAFLYLSGCPLVKIQPGYKKRLFVYMNHLKVPLRRKFVGLFSPNSVAEYRVVYIFTQKTEQETVHPNSF